MRDSRRRAWPGLAGLALAMIALAGMAAGCAPVPDAPAASSVPPRATIQPAPAITRPPTSGPAAPAPAVGPPASAKSLKLPMGVDANGSFYRGDPKAPVKLVEWSDYQ